MSRKPSFKQSNAVRIIPLGGLGEVGMNMMVIETDRDAIIIDCGVQFPKHSTPGIERVIPNMDYVKEISKRIRGVLITHGHLDHIGSLPYLMDHVNATIHAPRLASDMIRNELRKTGRLSRAQVKSITPGLEYDFGEFNAQWLPMCHSIPDSCSIYLSTPQGGIFHTGDFKFDNEPMIGTPTDYQKLSEIGRKGVRLLMSDSTNAESGGSSRSDRIAAEAIYREMSEARGRVIIASFSTQIARVQMVADAAHQLGRHVAILGRSMVETADLAQKNDLLELPSETTISIAEANSLPDEKVVIITTGSQGEYAAGIVRMARGDHREVRLNENDTVILSARTIPGNEVAVNEVLNNLAKRNVKAVTFANRPVHVSGHACREELKMMFNILRPELFVPIHGEYRMLRAHCNIALDMEMSPDDVSLIIDGDILELDEDGARVVGRAPSGNVLVQGQGQWEPEGRVMEERKSLSSAGVVFVALARRRGRLVEEPRIDTSGFVDVADADTLVRDALQSLHEAIASSSAESLKLEEIERIVKTCLSRFFFRRTKRRPLIMVTQIDLQR